VSGAPTIASVLAPESALPAPAAGPAATTWFPASYALIGTPFAGTHTLGNWQSDNAIDLAMPVGTPVVAVKDGVIGPLVGALDSSDARFAGVRLTLEGASDAYYYAHLSAAYVVPSQVVARGQLVGLSGSANGVAHLHLGARNGNPLGLAGIAAAAGPAS
jgi:murein DD-endopeptidase MepM/ murein hydrolase activator NlpD